jgi:hypothetical protein
MPAASLYSERGGLAYPLAMVRLDGPGDGFPPPTVPVTTLYQWRHLGIGPSAYRVGRHLRYEPTAVQAWLQQHANSLGRGAGSGRHLGRTPA